MTDGAEEPGLLTRMFGGLRPADAKPANLGPAEGEVARYGIGALAAASGVNTPRVRYWIKMGWFPETPYWSEGIDRRGDRRRYTASMVDAVERRAVEFGLRGKRRCDLAESEFGRRVSEAWWRSEHDRVPERSGAWRGERGWPDARPAEVIDLSTPEARRRAEIEHLRPKVVDDRAIDMSSAEARELARRGTPVFVDITRTDPSMFRRTP